MKQILLFFFSFGLISAATAQWRDHEDHDRNRYHRGNVSFGISIGQPLPYYNDNYYHDEFESRASAINQDFNHRIWDVTNNYELSRWEKRRIIHELNEQRGEKLNDLRRWHERDYEHRY